MSLLVLAMACAMLLNSARPLPKATNVLFLSCKKVRKKSVIIHHVYITLSIDPGLTGVDIPPTSKYHNLSLFLFCNALGLYTKLL